MSERGGTARVVPQGTILFKDISHLATLNDAMGELKDAAIFVKGNVIAWVGASGSIPEEYQTADKVVSMKNKVVIPGLVNTHHHMYQNLTRVVAQVCLARASRLRWRTPS
jgi:8-oxoguanine deaminase